MLLAYHEHTCFVVVVPAIVGRRKYSNDIWKALRTVPLVHFVAVDLHLVPSDYCYKTVVVKKLFHGLLSEVHRAVSLFVVAELAADSLVIFHRICPEKVAKHPFERDFFEPFDLVDFFNLLDVRRYASVHS
jgi:hypothetical protein